MVTRQRLALAAIVVICALLAWLQAGCGDNAEPDHAFTCTLLYRCNGDANITARISVECAGDVDEAQDNATEHALEAVDVACPSSWQYVRPLCQPQMPVTACDLSR